MPQSEIPRAEATDDTAIHPADVLLELAVAALAPLFLCAANTDIDIARLAACETLKAYRIETHADLLSASQIVAFGLATLSTLGQTATAGQSVATNLRLYATANALTRSGERQRKILDQTQRQRDQQAAAQQAQAENRMREDIVDAALADLRQEARHHPNARPHGSATQRHHSPDAGDAAVPPAHHRHPQDRRWTTPAAAEAAPARV